MKKNNILILIIPFFLISCYDDNKPEGPDLDTCYQFADDPDGCAAAGCVAASGYRRLLVDGRCVALVPYNCWPPFDEPGSNMLRSWCKVTDEGYQVVTMGTSNHIDMGTWNNLGDYPNSGCPYEGDIHSCYPEPNVCEQQLNEEDCHANYCMWNGGYKAVFEDETCIGWGEKFYQCMAPTVSSEFYNVTADGTEFYRFDEFSKPDTVFEYIAPETDFYDGSCSSYDDNPPAICSACDGVEQSPSSGQ